MRKAIPLGVVDYETLKNQNYFFIDKSMMIYDFLMRKSTVTLITRPRRFGKTINMSMMSSFFDITKDSKEIFKDTKIVETEYISEMNQYPTIFISFANAKNDKWNVVKEIKLQLRKEYDRYAHVFEQKMTVFEQNEYESLVQGLMTKNDGILDNIIDALSFLMERLEKYYHKKVMVFIDEYDTPFIEAHVGGYYEELRGGLSSLLHNALKTSTSLHYAMMTGIQRVAKENIFSDLNNLVVCTVKDPEYSQYFGFTEEETKQTLEYYDLSLNDEVKSMYDGYHFGEHDIYNPWSILNYASRKVLEPYWVNTSSNTMIKKAISSSDEAFERGYEELIRNGKLETTVKMDTSFFEVNNTENLWGLLVNAGYLTLHKTISIQDSLYIIKIPNQEVQLEFRKLTAYHLKATETDLTVLFNSLKRCRKEDFEDRYRKILLTLPSYHDLKDENSYHMMLLGMCAWLSSEYEVISNREVGKGRCDIILKSKKNQISYILEFKYTNDSSVDLKQLAKSAIDQIDSRRYDSELSGTVIHIGLAHYQKNVEIEWQ
ncbi:AAA family ATPase [Catenibacterium mitsuokai]|uniref:AAA family ATPase n=1 Tax=Catenibacterium mitsuokai TaxID=100886 RepID=UPI001C2142CC|nr:AAA family ATPase [Catenibacterium mitsuokai]MBU9056434.1 ATP-binding protein [Catenibacterium mitsuokai]MCB5427136.1 ATP-binding protein [Catenibacterium mitsuokai]